MKQNDNHKNIKQNENHKTTKMKTNLPLSLVRERSKKIKIIDLRPLDLLRRTPSSPLTNLFVCLRYEINVIN